MALVAITGRDRAQGDELRGYWQHWGLRLQGGLLDFPPEEEALRRYLVRYALEAKLKQPLDEVHEAMHDAFGGAWEGSLSLPPQDVGQGEPGLDSVFHTDGLPPTHDLALTAVGFLEDLEAWGAAVFEARDNPLAWLRERFAWRLLDHIRKVYGRAPTASVATEADRTPAEPASSPSWRHAHTPDPRGHHETAELLGNLWELQLAVGRDTVAGAALATCYDDAVGTIWEALQARASSSPDAVGATLIRKLVPIHSLATDPDRAPHCAPLSDGVRQCVRGAWSQVSLPEWPEHATALAASLEGSKRGRDASTTPVAGLEGLARCLDQDQAWASVDQAGLLTRRLAPHLLGSAPGTLGAQALARQRNALQALISRQQALYAARVRDLHEAAMDRFAEILDLAPEYGR